MLGIGANRLLAWAMHPALPKPLPQSTTYVYAIAAGPVFMLGLPFSVYLPPYISAGGVISVGMVGLLFSLTTLWDGIVDPLIGTMIDRKSTGAAPHRGWMLRAAAPLLLLLLIIATVGDRLDFWPLLACVLLFYSCFSLFDVAHLSWGSALAGSPDESTRLFGAREMAAKLLLVAAFAVPAIAQAAIPGLSLQGRILAYLSLILLAMPAALWAIFRLPQRAIAPTPSIDWRAELRITARSAPLLLLFTIQFFNSFAFGALSSLFVFYADGVLGLDNRSSLLLFATFLGGALTTPIWTRLARRFGKANMMIAMGVTVILVMSGHIWHVPDGAGQAFLASLLLGAGFVGLIFTYGILSDLAPMDAVDCGRDRTAFLFAIINLMQKFGSAAAVATTYALLDAIGFNARDASASASQILFLFAGVPMTAWIIMSLLLLRLRREPSLANQRAPH